MHKKQQDRKRRKSSVSRYFRHNLGTIDGYEVGARLIPDPKAHFDIEFNLLGDVDNDGTLIAQNLSGTSSVRELQIYNLAGVFTVRVGGTLNSLSTILTTGVFRLVFDGADINVLKGGVIVETKTLNVGASSEPTATMTFCIRHSGSLSAYTSSYEGVIADVVIRNSSGQIANSYDINEESGIPVFDKIGGNNANIINGIDDDRGLFTEHPTLWKGQDLAVPPWDSVDQELLKS